MLCTILLVFAFTLTNGQHDYRGIYTDKSGAKQIREKLPEINKLMTEDPATGVTKVEIVNEETFPEFDCKKGPKK